MRWFTDNVRLYVSGLIAPNKNIWLLGDVFLTDAVAILSQMQMKNKDELYLYQAYGVQSYYPKKLCSDSFGKQIRSQLYSALEEHNRLPAVIIVVLGNSKLDDMVSTPFQTKRIWKALCTEIDRTIKARKNDLPKKAFLNEEPRLFFTEIYPTHKDLCERTGKGFDSYKAKRRRLNNILPQVAANYEFGVLPINGILPEVDDYFVKSTGQLSGKGIELFWKAVAKQLRLADEKLKEKIKNKIIQNYFEEQEDQARIEREKRKIVQDRYSLPRNFPRQERGHGDNRRSKSSINTSNRSKNNHRGRVTHR